jgi:parvulin-like peptidyl-prolyl isomerase
MLDERDLTLPEEEPISGRRVRWVPLLLVVLLCVALANLLVALVGTTGSRAKGQGGLTADQQQELAAKLEEQGLNAAAARAWERFARGSQLEGREAAKRWFRIGRLYQQGGQPERAVEAYLRSQAQSSVIELASDIERHVQECLEALGKDGLAGEAGGEEGPAEGAPVVAEIGPETVTAVKLDRLIGEQVDRQLEQLNALVPPETREERRQALLDRYAQPDARRRVLQEYIVQELLYRKAREDDLLAEPETRDRFRRFRRRFLAQRVVEREMAEKVTITSGDVKRYYHANLGKYRRPERARVARILVADREAAQNVLERLKAGEAFAKLAREVSLDTASKEGGGVLSGWLEKGARLANQAASEDLTEAVFSTERGQVADRLVETERGVHIIKVLERQPAKQLPFEEVREQVYRDLRAAKSREVQERLIARLHVRYGVRVYPDRIEGEGPPEKAAGEPKASKE